MATNLTFDVVALDKASQTFIKMADRIDKMAERLDKLDGKTATATADVDTKKGEVKLKGFLGELAKLDGKEATAHINAKVDKSFTDSIVHVTRLGASLATLAKPIAIGAAAPQILGLAAAAAQASQSLLLLPAAGAAGATVFAALKIGATGFGDAMTAVAEGDLEKFNEAIAKLSPNARAAAGAVMSMKPAWDAMRIDVQDALFRNLGTTMTAVGTTYIPIMRTGLAGVAGDMNAAAIATGGFLTSAQATSSVSTIFSNTSESMGEMKMVGADITAMLLDIATVGSEFLPGLAGGFASGTESARAFIAEARQTGELHTWISQGLSTLGDLASVLINVGISVRAVFTGASADGAGFAKSLLDLTARMATFLQSAQGQEQIGTLFDTLRTLGAALAPIIGLVATTLMNMINQVGPALPAVGTAVAAVVTAAQPLLTIFTSLVAAVLPPLAAILTTIAPILGPIAGAIIAMSTAMAIYNTVTSAVTTITQVWAARQLILNAVLSANPIGLVVTALVGLAAILVYAWNNSETFRNIVMGAWQGIQTAAAAVWGFLQGVFAGLMTAVSAVGSFFAAAWSAIVTAVNVAGSVIGVVVGAIGTALSAVGTAAMWLWTNAIQPAFNFIAEAAKILVAILVTIVLTPILIAVNLLGPPIMALWTNYIQPAFAAIGDFIASIWNGFILPVFTAIQTWVANTLSAAFNAFRDAVAAVWNAISTAISSVWNGFILPIFNAVVAYLSGVFTTTWNFYRDLVMSVWAAIQAGINAAWTFIRDNIFTPVVNFLAAVLGPAFNAVQAVISGAWQMIQDVLNAGWTWIKTNVFDPIVNFVTKTIPDGFSSAVELVRGVWDKIKQATRDPIQAVIDVVYNEGIVAAWNKIAGFLGIGGLETFTLPQYREGGAVFGGTPGKDSVPLMAMGGEYILSKKAVRAAGGVNQVDAWHQALKSGRSGSHGRTPAYQMYGGDEGNPGLAYVGMQAGGPVDAALAYARQQNGKPYQWGGVGNPSFDCSGFISAITSVLQGKPVQRLFTTASFAGGGAGGFQRGTGSQFVIGVDQGNPGHMAGNLAGVPVESNGSGVTVGRGRSPSAFGAQFFLPEVGGTFSDVGGGGNGTSPLDWLKNLVGFMLDTPGKLAGGFPMADMMKDFGGKSVGDTWDWFLNKVTSMWSTIWGAVSDFFGGDSSGPVVDIVRAAATAYGWDQGEQWNAIDWIVSKESSWSPTAQNPTSSAYGLFQFVDKTWATVGSAKSSSPQVQAAAGMRYIASSYKTPVGAKAFHQANGYYANGGIINRPTFGVVGEAGPEVILPINRPQRSDSLLRQAGFADGVSEDGLTTSGVEQRLDALIETIERRGAGATINVMDRSGDPTETARSTVLALRMS